MMMVILSHCRHLSALFTLYSSGERGRSDTAAKPDVVGSLSPDSRDASRLQIRSRRRRRGG